MESGLSSRGRGKRDGIAGESAEIPVLRRALSSGGSRAANAYDAPRKHGLSIAGGGGNRKGLRRGQADRGRAGFPMMVAPTATSRVTTLPAPITAPSPMVTPGRMMAPPP